MNKMSYLVIAGLILLNALVCAQEAPTQASASVVESHEDYTQEEIATLFRFLNVDVHRFRYSAPFAHSASLIHETQRNGERQQSGHISLSSDRASGEYTFTLCLSRHEGEVVLRCVNGQATHITAPISTEGLNHSHSGTLIPETSPSEGPVPIYTFGAGVSDSGHNAEDTLVMTVSLSITPKDR